MHVFIHTSLLDKLASFISHFQYLHKHLTAAEFKDCVRSCKVCFFSWKKSLELFVLKNPPCASQALGWACRCVYRTKYITLTFTGDKTNFNHIFERKQLMTFVCVISIFFSIYPWYWTAIAGFFTSFSEEKLSFNLTLAVKYFSAAVTAQCPRHIFGGNSHSPNNFGFLFSYSYKSCIFLIATYLLRKLDILFLCSILLTDRLTLLQINFFHNLFTKSSRHAKDD